ncbi:MAG: hypothetical protein HONBIEJF_00880 [Fimbriimonadaceae bacterium]|nr:hypothetical protein [Fimbriimonadaceae bacterium]
MNRLIGLVISISLFVLAGCGGKSLDGEVLNREITGLITDIDGNPVRGARVSSGPNVTFSGSSGAYSLQVRDDEFVEIFAEVDQDGVHYTGQNVATSFKDTLAQNVNIAVERIDRQGAIFGTVYDRVGREVANARVFASGAGLSSAMTKTDGRGRYEIHGLAAGLIYTVSASAFGYSSDFLDTSVRSGESKQIDFQMGEALSTLLPPPSNLSAVSWVSPFADSRSDNDQEAQAIEAVKRLFDKKRPVTVTRDRGSFAVVEVDLYWDPILSVDLLGYGIYRGANNQFAEVTFLRDPLAGAYIDLDPNLRENSAYGYRVTSLNTLYPDDQQNGESDPSELVTVITLNRLDLLSVLDNPTTFRWTNSSGAEEFVVFLFDRYPAIGVESFWNNADQPTFDLELEYTGPALSPGRTYYYLVLGLADGQTARTISEVGSFVAR